MHWCSLIFASLLAFPAAQAADGELFDFSDLDFIEPTGSKKSEPPPVPPNEDGLPEDIRSVLRKLDRFSTFKRTALNDKIVAGRQVAAEILVRSAAKSDAATRASLLTEAKRVESLPPEHPLIDAPASPNAKVSPAAGIALGSWKKNGAWTITLTADGTLVRGDGWRGLWRWVDERRGALVVDYTPGHPWAEFFQIDLKSKPLKAICGSEWGEIFSLLKIESVQSPAEKKIAPPEPVTKLAVHETAAQKETENLIKSKNEKVAAWLLQQAPSLPAPQARVVVERASELEGKPAAAGAKDAGSFAGVWVWGGKKLEFAEGGIVKVNKRSGGRWVWAKAGPKSLIAFSLDADDLVATARLSKSKEGVIHIMPLKSKATEAQRE